MLLLCASCCQRCQNVCHSRIDSDGRGRRGNVSGSVGVSCRSFARTVVWSKRILVKYNYTVYFVVHPVFDGTSRSDRTIARSLGFRKPRAHVASYTVLSPFRERVFPSCGTKRSLVAFLWGVVGRSVDFFNFGISHSVDETEPVSHLFCFSFVAVISLLDIEIIDGSCCRIDPG